MNARDHHSNRGGVLEEDPLDRTKAAARPGDVGHSSSGSRTYSESFSEVSQSIRSTSHQDILKSNGDEYMLPLKDTPSQSTVLYRSSASISSAGSGGSSNGERTPLKRYRSTQRSSFTSPRTSITSALAPQPRQRNSLDEFTLHKLKYSALKLFGRDQEVNLLKEALGRLVSGKVDRSLVLVKGYSGVGKTALVDSLRDVDLTQLRETERDKETVPALLESVFVRGKFDQQLRQEPYYGLIGACTEICESLGSLKDRFDDVRAKLMAELGSELTVLIKVVPAMRDLLKQGDIDQLMEDNKKNCMDTQGPVEGKSRLRFAFQRFIRIVTSFLRPLILVLDDLQWADGPSLELLEALVVDQENSGILLLGIFRSNEVTEGDNLCSLIENLHKRCANNLSASFEMKEISLRNLGLADVNMVIQSLLQSDELRTNILAEVCFKKTHGNAFFLLQYLSMLCEANLLVFNFGTLQWDWDNARIEETTCASDNVVDMLVNKMKLLSQDHILALQLAGSLGASFEKRSLLVLWTKLRTDDSVSEADNELAISNDESSANDESSSSGTGFVDNSITFFITEGYIEETNDGNGESCCSFRWVHDAIQEAALVLIPEKDRAQFDYRVGEILLAHYSEAELSPSIFEVVNLLNRGDQPADLSRRIHFAKLNLEACKKAMGLAAFESAATYAATGIALLGEDPWSQDAKLALELYICAAESESDLGRFEVMERYCKEVFATHNVALEDKLPIYTTWFDGIHAQGDSSQAADLSLDLLARFGCTFPRSSIGITLKTLASVVKIKGSMDNLHPETLSPMNDPVKGNLMLLLDRLAEYFYLAESPMVPLPIFKSLSWTFKFGYCDRSPAALATTAIMLTSVLNDLQAGRLFANKAIQLQGKSNNRQTLCRTHYCAFGLVLHWTTPFRDVLKPVYRAYESGMQVGDTDNACWSIFHSLIIRFLAGGCTLEGLQIDCRKYAAQMRDLKRSNAENVTKEVGQVCLCLMGRPRNQNKRLVGEMISEEENTRLKNDKFAHHLLLVYEGFLLCFLGHHIEHADQVLAMGLPTLEDAHLCSPNIMMDNLVIGVSCLAAARTTGKRKYKRKGNKSRQKIKKWVKNGNPNVRFAETLLDAEWEALHGRKFLAIKNYELAVHLAARKGVFHEACLASERLGQFQLEVMNDKDEASFRLKEALKYAREWGALAKVSQLQSKYGSLWLEAYDQ